mmetsp:Transcript_39253/g.99688  ORF Transcript_39253/g.99688 Transcript_39253/m.99688 type:complete len:232 (+) Transcript_39253:135-830(+)
MRTEAVKRSHRQSAEERWDFCAGSLEVFALRRSSSLAELLGAMGPVGACRRRAPPRQKACAIGCKGRSDHEASLRRQHRRDQPTLARSSPFSHLLLLALDAAATWATLAAAFPIFVVVSLAAAGHVDLVRVGGLHWVDVRDLVDLHAGVVLLERGHVQRRRQEGTDLLLVLRCEGLREFDRQDQEEVAVHKGVLERRHALILDGFHHPEALLGLGIRQHVHGATLARLLRR